MLLHAVAGRAAELGLEQLLLSARGGTALPGYYAARGWTEVGVWPGAIRLADDDRRDEHRFQLRPNRAAECRGSDVASGPWRTDSCRPVG
ncbi:hypothetical protein [Pseudonocardia lacus]|uniref:hypothetical protein n=1 Tax=Pseudonocardia lacus TaxID=2835865 RepID=UPI001BDC2C68|nr:hypothetical protein [Pseudonocardia lacus]